MKVDTYIAPGNALGVLGGGQLGQMFCLASRALGYVTHVYSNEEECPAKSVCDVLHVGSYDDLEKIKKFCHAVKAVTIEFENIPLTTLQYVETICPARPSSQTLAIAQNRVQEKKYFQNLQIPTAKFVVCLNQEGVEREVRKFPLPAVLKTTSMGYDGKGQWKVNTLADCPKNLPNGEYILESLIPLEKEVSVIVGRNISGELTLWEPVQNAHTNHILDVSVVPADIAEGQRLQLQKYTTLIATHLNLEGVLCVEFFISKEGEILANEMAPRPHNSGHWTIEGAKTSQFAQQTLALANAPLGKVEMTSPYVVMANILGDIWNKGEPNFGMLEEMPGAFLHLYGKKSARPGRKMGHFTILGKNREKLMETIKLLRASF